MLNKIKDFISALSKDKEEQAPISNEIYRGGARGGIVTPIDKVIARKGMRIYTEMRTDEQVKASLLLKKYAVLAGRWEIQPASDQPEDVRRADFIKFSFEQMKGTVKQNLLEILTALDYGFSISEKIYTRSSIGEFKNMIILHKIKTKHPVNYQFDIDEFGNILPDGLIHTTTRRRLKMSKFIHYPFDSEFSNVYGNSDLRAAYRAYFVKTIIVNAWNIYIERFGMPTPVAKYLNKTTPSQQNTLQLIMDRLQFKSSILLPADLVESLEFLEASGRGAEVFTKALDYYDRAIAKSILTPDQLGIGGKESAGSNAKARTHKDVFFLAVDKIKDDLSDTVIGEQVIKPLIDFNFLNTEVYPKFVFLPVDKADKKEIAQIWAKAVTDGVVQQDLEDTNAFRSLLDFPLRDNQVDSTGTGTVKDSPEITPPEGVVTDQQVDSGDQQKKMSQICEYSRFSRKLTDFEKKVDFAKIERMFFNQEKDFVVKLSSIIKIQRDKLLNKVKKAQLADKLNPEFINKLKSGINKQARPIIKETLVDTYKAAKKDAKKELRKAGKMALEEPLMPQEALDFFENKSFFISDTIDENITRNVKGVIYNGLKTGLSVGTMASKIKDVYTPWIMDPDTIEKSGFRIETIVRTNINEALNEGRVHAFKSSVDDGFIIGYFYSAILDGRETDICNFLDSKILKPNDPVDVRLRPTNHFNCRSIITPVTRDEGPVSFINESDKNRALTLQSKLKFK